MPQPTSKYQPLVDVVKGLTFSSKIELTECKEQLKKQNHAMHII